MALTSEQLDALITIFRKENEDLTISKIKEMFQIQYGEFTILEGETKSIALPEAYSNSGVYEIKFYQATDTEGTNIIDALVIDDQQAGSFDIYSPREATVRWQTGLKTPLLNFWT